LCRHSPGDRGCADETYAKVLDPGAARRFFRKALSALTVEPVEVVTDTAPVYPAILHGMAPQVWRKRDRTSG
jgi:transposase-like protein